MLLPRLWPLELEREPPKHDSDVWETSVMGTCKNGSIGLRPSGSAVIRSSIPMVRPFLPSPDHFGFTFFFSWVPTNSRLGFGVFVGFLDVVWVQLLAFTLGLCLLSATQRSVVNQVLGSLKISFFIDLRIAISFCFRMPPGHSCSTGGLRCCCFSLP